MKKRFNDFFEAYTFLSEHKMVSENIEPESSLGLTLSRFRDCLDIEVVKVNPKNDTAELDESLNTKTAVWLEFGAWDNTEKIPFHDYDLDCGGNTFEEAIIELANLVDKLYDEKTGKKL